MLNPTSATLQLLGRYVLTLARYDQDYDVRDRARLVASLLMGVVPNILGDEEYDKGEHGGVILRREQVKMVLFEHKAGVNEPSALEGAYSLVGALDGAYVESGTDGFSLATSSLVIGRAMALIQDLPEWLEQGTESSLRDTEDDIQPSGLPQATASRSIASASYGPAPIVLTPTGRHSPAVTGNSQAPWTDLDQFYADVDEGTENGSDVDGGANDSEDDGEASGASESAAESASEDEETGPDSGGSVAGQGILGDDLV